MLMHTRFLLSLMLLACAAVHGAPLPNLALACDQRVIGRPLEECSDYVYRVPTNELLVLTGSWSALFWASAADLDPDDVLVVCTIPVEPGFYSSCRDASGVRRMALVRKDSVIGGGRNSVTVSKAGGDYTDPVTAAANAFSGDTWCVAPQWPLEPCFMAIGSGVFILHETLSIPDGLAVSGNGKGDTMLVADNGVETAVSSFGNVRISDLTIVNTQLSGGRTIGLNADMIDGSETVQLNGMAIHVAAASQNVAIAKNVSLEILDSAITAVGQATAGISQTPHSDAQANLTVERSFVLAATALHEQDTSPGKKMRLLDSHIFGAVLFDQENSQLEILGTKIVGNVVATNDNVTVRIDHSNIKGSVNVIPVLGSARDIYIANTNVEGNLAAGHSANSLVVEGLTVQGEFLLEHTNAEVRRSYIINTVTTAPALTIRSAHVDLRKTFIRGAQALVGASPLTRIEVSSSVLAGYVSASAGSVLTCADTYGEDYELLNTSCQPQGP